MLPAIQAKPAALNSWRNIVSFLMQERHLKPWEISKMTLSEILSNIEDIPNHPGDSPGGAAQIDAQSYQQWVRSLSMTELLDCAIDGTL